MNFQENSALGQSGNADSRSMGLKHAALRLHSLSEVDQKWCLEQIPLEHQEPLQVLLRELGELGVPKTLLANSDPILFVGNSNSQGDVSQDWRKQVDSLNAYLPKQVAGALAAEPAFLIASLMHIYPWSWTSEVLDNLGMRKKREIQDWMNNPQAVFPREAAKLSQILVGTLLEKLGMKTEAYRPPETRPSSSGLDSFSLGRRFKAFFLRRV